MSTAYLTEEEYLENCFLWASINEELNSRYSPNPWRFHICFRPYPQEARFVVVFRNFEQTRELTVDSSSKDGVHTFQCSERYIGP